MKSLRPFCILLALFLIIPTLSFGQIDFDSIRTSIDSIMIKKKGVGAQVLIFSSDSILFDGNYGYADVEADIPMTSETMMRIGSITKSFVAVAAMQEVEKGTLSLKDKLSDLAPDFEYENKYRDEQPILVEHLLEHTAGWDDIHLKEYAQVADGWTLEEGIQFHPVNRKSRWVPGLYYSYCNSGPPAVAYILQTLTNQDFESYVDENIFTRLGMDKSTFVQTADTEKWLAQGYGGDQDEKADYWHITQRPAGSINSTATELSQFTRMLMNDGMYDGDTILTKASVDRIKRCETLHSARSGSKGGYGLHSINSNVRGYDWYGHDGGMMGFLAKSTYSPELDLGFIVLCNSNNGAIGAINKYLYNTLTPPEEKDIQVQGEFDDNHLGYYRSALSRNQQMRIMDVIFAHTRIGKDEEGYYSHNFLSDDKLRGRVQAENELWVTGASGDQSLYAFNQYKHKKILQKVQAGTSLTKTNIFGYYFPLVTLAIFMIWIVGGFFIEQVRWFTAKFFKKKSYIRMGYSNMLLSFVGVIIFLITGQQGDVMAKLGTPTIYSFGIAISMWLLVISIIVYLYRFVKNGSKIGWIAKVPNSIFATFAVVVLGAILYYQVFLVPTSMY